MLSKKERIPRKAFNTLLLRTDLRTVYNRLGTIKYIPEGRGLSVVVGARHEKRAVRRNRLRRRIYSLFNGVKDTSITGILYASKQSYRFEIGEIKELFNELLFKTRKNI